LGLACFAAACGTTAPSAPTVSPTSQQTNYAPSVTVAFQTASVCSPVPCTLAVTAQAVDRDGDPLTYRWSGCAAGTSSQAVCTVSQVGQVTASVDVSDGRGHTTTASAVGEGRSNRPPSVSVMFQGASSCVPIPPLDSMPGRTCGLPVVAQATDPDGDALAYTWSGCASSYTRSAQNTCIVTQVGPVTATVQVSDGNGHTATASVAGEGTNPPPDFVNHPPSLTVGFFPLPGGSPTLEGLGMINDPEEGELCGGGTLCPYLRSATISGDCKTNQYAFTCGCLGGVEFDIYRTAASGTCQVLVTVRDSWGLVGTSTFTVPYGQAMNNLLASLDFPFLRPPSRISGGFIRRQKPPCVAPRPKP
jgi:hypothetical protein